MNLNANPVSSDTLLSSPIIVHLCLFSENLTIFLLVTLIGFTSARR